MVFAILREAPKVMFKRESMSTWTFLLIIGLEGVWGTFDDLYMALGFEKVPRVRFVLSR